MNRLLILFISVIILVIFSLYKFRFDLHQSVAQQ
jgi:hypothetical protein